MKQILNQDRDRSYQLVIWGLHTHAIPGMGVQLLMDMTATPDSAEYKEPNECAFLGLFDTLQEAVEEIYRITTSTESVYQVSGYSNSDDEFYWEREV